jgi:hypothetical protein
MKILIRSVLLGLAMLIAPIALRAEVAPAAAAPATFSSQQLADGLKSGLGTIIAQALNQGNLNVTAPSALAKVETVLGKTDGPDKTAGFSEAFSAVVAQVAPQASSLLQATVKDLKVDDAKPMLAGGSDAATQYLKKAIGPAVREKLLPLVKQATASSGLAAKARDMLAAAGPLAGFGGGKAVSDLDGYLCDQVIAQSFALIGKQEAAVRANPALLTNSPLAQQVFALFKK